MMLLYRGLAAFLVIGFASLQAAPPPGYSLAFSDEFTGRSLDTSKWTYRTDARFWSKQIAQNVSVTGGSLAITGRKQKNGSLDYTGGGIISRSVFRYGYYESRLKVPPGAGWHSSFWMMRFNPPKNAVIHELDVFENDSVNLFRYGVNTHQHRPIPYKTIGHKSVATPDLSADFHVFGCEFTPATVRYFRDGEVVQTVDATKFAHGDVNIWLTMIAAPLGDTKAVDDSKLPARAAYDYVRFYRKSAP